MNRIKAYLLFACDTAFDLWTVFLGLGAAAIGYMMAPDDFLARVAATLIAFLWALAILVGYHAKRRTERRGWEQAIKDARELERSNHVVPIESRGFQRPVLVEEPIRKDPPPYDQGA